MSEYLNNIIENKNSICNMQIIVADIVAYSQRKIYKQVDVVNEFMNALGIAISRTADRYDEYATKNNINFRNDIVILPSGDGATVGLPFGGLPDIHLVFAKELIEVVHNINQNSNCLQFDANEWCDCHTSFKLRIGMGEGRIVLFKDINGNFNIVGHEVNMAVRAMNSAKCGQIFFTENAYNQLINMRNGMENRFIAYKEVKIKHELEINIYQYTDEDAIGLNSSINENLRDHVSHETAIGSDYLTTDKIIDFGGDLETENSLLFQIKQRLVIISNGTFNMGNAKTGTVSRTISSAYYIDRFPITQALYQKVIDNNPCRFKGEDLPVENITWFDAVEFCNKLSAICGLNQVYEIVGKKVLTNYEAEGFRLPTETEWEYACRGHSAEDRYGKINEIAWYNSNSEKRTHAVGQLDPNGFGLYDMLGNVWEWCNDWFTKTYSDNPLGPEKGIERVLRGGSWADIAYYNQASYRHRKDPHTLDDNIGMRVVTKASGVF